MYVSDEAAESIASMRSQIEQERASTIKRIDEWRAVHARNVDRYGMEEGDSEDRRLEFRERTEWEHFYRRIAPLQQEIDVVTRLLADKAALEGPAPMILPR